MLNKVYDIGYKQRMETTFIKGVELLNEGKLTEAIICFAQVTHLMPDNIAALTNIANTMQAAGRLDEAIYHFRAVLKQASPPLAFRIASNYLTTLNYYQGVTTDQLLASAREIGSQLGHAEQLPVRIKDKTMLRLGFVSADLCDHPVGLFLKPLLKALDRINGVRLD